MKPWLKLGSVAVTLALLAACSSGIQQPDLELGDEAPELSTQGINVSNVVPNSASDAEENAAGEAYTTSTVLELGYRTDGTPQTTGVRFLGVAVPKGARVTSAFIRFTADTDKSGASNLTIAGQDVASAGPFSGTTNNITSRTKTSAKATWEPGAWVDGQRYNSSSISGVVQELVNRSDWQQGAAMVFIISGTGIRKAVSYDQSSTLAPKLYVTYEPEPTTNPEIAVWQSKLENALAKSGGYYDPKEMAGSNDLYKYGRSLNNALTSLTASYRITKDRDTALYIQNILNIMKSKLSDTNGDGYKNWRYLSDQSSISECRAKLTPLPDTDPKYCGTDTHEMDEMLTHASLAGAVYTLQQAGFTSDVSFWKGYLKNDFEAKWRKRSNKSSGYPFLDRTLLHPTAQFARYHYYMYKLTGTGSYYNEAKRLVGLVKGTMRTSGSGYVWAHRRSSTSGCQPTTYIRYTISAMADLAAMDSSLYDATFMSKVANTMAYKVLKSSSGERLANDACGNGEFSKQWIFTISPYAAVAPWDASGKLESALRSAEGQVGSAPYNVPAMMILSLGR